MIIKNFPTSLLFHSCFIFFLYQTVADQQKTKELEKVETKVSDPAKEVPSVSDRKEKQVKRHHSTEKKEKERHKEKSKDGKEKVKDSKSGTKDGKKGKSGLEVDPEIEDLLTNREEGECRKIKYSNIIFDTIFHGFCKITVFRSCKFVVNEAMLELEGGLEKMKI